MMERTTLKHIYSSIWNISKVDLLLFNDYKGPNDVTPDDVIVLHKLSIKEWNGIFRKLQEENLGRHFGADNPWITNPPDNHPCMPGIPDDKVDLLLHLLLRML